MVLPPVQHESQYLSLFVASPISSTDVSLDGNIPPASSARAHTRSDRLETSRQWSRSKRDGGRPSNPVTSRQRRVAGGRHLPTHTPSPLPQGRGLGSPFRGVLTLDAKVDCTARAVVNSGTKRGYAVCRFKATGWDCRLHSFPDPLVSLRDGLRAGQESRGRTLVHLRLCTEGKHNCPRFQRK